MLQCAAIFCPAKNSRMASVKLWKAGIWRWSGRCTGLSSETEGYSESRRLCMNCQACCTAALRGRPTPCTHEKAAACTVGKQRLVLAWTKSRLLRKGSPGLRPLFFSSPRPQYPQPMCHVHDVFRSSRQPAHDHRHHPQIACAASELMQRVYGRRPLAQGGRPPSVKLPGSQEPLWCRGPASVVLAISTCERPCLLPLY